MWRRVVDWRGRLAGLAASLALQVPAEALATGLVLDAPTGLGSWRLAPSVALTQTLTSHVQAADAQGTADAITDASAGLVLRSGAGVLTGMVDYRLSGLYYARDRARTTTRHTLNTHLDAELCERCGFLAVDASVGRQAISAFGFQPVGGAAQISSNITDTASVRLAPRWQGLLPGGLRGDLTASYGATRSRGTATGDSDQGAFGLHVSPQILGRLGWSGDLQWQQSSFKAGRTSDSVTLFGTVSYLLDALDTQLSLSGGRQRSDLMSVDQRNYAYWSVAGAWVPSSRSALRVTLGDQAFGRSHELSFEHRTGLLSLRISAARSLNTSGVQSGATLLGTAFQLFDGMYTAKEPDPVKRAELVNALLKERGISADASVAGGYLASSATVVDSQNLSLGLQGLRSTATLVVTRSSSVRAGRLVTVADDLSTSSRVRLRGVSLAASHALTPLSSVGLSLGIQSSQGGDSVQGNGQRSVNLNYNARLSSTTGWSLGMRRALVESGVVSYDENAIFASVAAQF